MRLSHCTYSSNYKGSLLHHQDNPVGKGDGKYNGKRLFRAPMRHASLVPLEGLIKAEDFDGKVAGEKVDDVQIGRRGRRDVTKDMSTESLDERRSKHSSSNEAASSDNEAKVDVDERRRLIQKEDQNRASVVVTSSKGNPETYPSCP
jgi:hypothetical protein